jgi:carbon storage regulator
MLVLSRKTRQAILIDGHIRVEVVRICGDKVRIGITAPDDMSVHREEVQEAIWREQQAEAEGQA